MKFEQLIREYTTGNYTFGFELECLFPKRLIQSNVRDSANVEYEIVVESSLIYTVKKLTNNDFKIMKYVNDILYEGITTQDFKTLVDLAKTKKYKIDLLDIRKLIDYCDIDFIRDEHSRKLIEMDTSFELPNNVKQLVDKYDVEITIYREEVEVEDAKDTDTLIKLAQSNYFDAVYPKYFNGAKCESEYDASIKLEDLSEDEYFPIEVKSSIVNFGINKLSNLSKFLTQCVDDGIVTNKSCGFHVHYKFEDMSQLDAIWVGINYLFNPNKKLYNALTVSNIPNVKFATEFSNTPASDKNMAAYFGSLYQLLVDGIDKDDKVDTSTFLGLLYSLFQDKHNNYPLLLIHPEYGTFEWRGLRGILDNGNANIAAAIKHIYTSVHEINMANENNSFEIEPGIAITKNYIQSILKDLNTQRLTYPTIKNKTPFDDKVVIDAFNKGEILKKMMPLYKKQPMDVLDAYEFRNTKLTMDGYEATIDHGVIDVVKSAPTTLNIPDSISFTKVIIDLMKRSMSLNGSGIINHCAFLSGIIDLKSRDMIHSNIFMDCQVSCDSMLKLLKYNYLFPCGLQNYDYLDMPLTSDFQIVVHREYLDLELTGSDTRNKLIFGKKFDDKYSIINKVDVRNIKSRKFGNTVGSFANYIVDNYYGERIKQSFVSHILSSSLWKAIDEI